jgi:hypothetical protein
MLAAGLFWAGSSDDDVKLPDAAWAMCAPAEAAAAAAAQSGARSPNRKRMVRACARGRPTRVPACMEGGRLPRRGAAQPALFARRRRAAAAAPPRPRRDPRRATTPRCYPRAPRRMRACGASRSRTRPHRSATGSRPRRGGAADSPRASPAIARAAARAGDVSGAARLAHAAPPPPRPPLPGPRPPRPPRPRQRRKLQQARLEASLAEHRDLLQAAERRARELEARLLALQQGAAAAPAAPLPPQLGACGAARPGTPGAECGPAGAQPGTPAGSPGSPPCCAPASGASSGAAFGAPAPTSAAVPACCGAPPAKGCGGCGPAGAGADAAAQGRVEYCRAISAVQAFVREHRLRDLLRMGEAAARGAGRRAPSIPQSLPPGGGCPP